MKKLTTALMVLSLVLGGVALAMAADVPQASKTVDLSGFQKITDQEAQEIRGTGLVGFGPQYQNQTNNPGYAGSCNPDCPQSLIQSTTSTPQTQSRTRSFNQLNLPAGTPMLKRPGNSW